MSTPPTDPSVIARGLSQAQRAVLLDPRFDPKGWEPKNPWAPLISEMVDLGLFERRDGRCGFEAFRDSFVVPTPPCLAVRDYLLSQQGEKP